MADDLIKLSFKYEGGAEVAALKEKHVALNAELGALTAALGRDEIAFAEYVQETHRVEESIRNVEQAMHLAEQAAKGEAGAAIQTADALRDLDVANTKVAASTKHVADAGRDAGKGLRQAQQGALDISRATQDFAQGGIGGILNNLEGLGRAIPALLKNPMALLTSIPGMLTLVGVALWQFGTPVYEAFRHFALGSNEIPKATTALGKIDDRLKEVTKSLEAYREKQRLTNGELADYNKLSLEQIRLEHDKVKALEDAARAKKFAEQDTGKEAEAKERAELFDDTLGRSDKFKGGQTAEQKKKAFAAAIEKALPEDERRKRQEELGTASSRQAAHQADDPFDLTGMAGTLQRNVDKAKAALTAENERRKKEADKLARDAVIGGDREATEKIRKLQEKQITVDPTTGARGVGPGPFTPGQIQAVDNADVEDHRKEKFWIEKKAKADAKERKSEEAYEKALDEWHAYELEEVKKALAERERVFKEKLTNHINEMKDTDKIDEIVTDRTARAGVLKLNKKDTFDFVKLGVKEAIEAAFEEASGVKIPLEMEAKAQEQIGDVAAQAAGGAPAAAARNVKDDDEARRAQRKVIDQSGATASAGAVYARAKARGATPDQAFDITAQEALKFINRPLGPDRFGRQTRANAGMSEEKKNVLATQMASQGRHEANAGVTKLAGQNLDVTGKLLAVAKSLDAEVAQLQAKVAAMSNEADNLKRGNRQRTAQKR